MSKKKKGNKVVIILIIILVILIVGLGAFVYLNKVFTNSTTRYSSYYQEPENSLDGIYLGSSAAYDFFMPTRAYEEEGICIYNLGTTVQPSCIQKNIIADALRTQDDMDVIVIELRNMVKANNDNIQRYIRSVTDGMHWGSDRFDAIDTALAYYKEMGEKGNYNKWSYYFPAVRVVHAGSYGLTKKDLLLKKNPKTPYKGFSVNGCEVIGGLPDPVEYKDEAEITDLQERTLRELLDYCKTIEPEVIFVSTPFNPNTGYEYKLGQMNTLCRICEEEGFTALNFNQEPLKSELDVDWKKDYRDRAHTNAFGAARYSTMLAGWLRQNVDSLKDDHRGEAGYEDWDKQAEDLNAYLKENLKGWK